MIRIKKILVGLLFVIMFVNVVAADSNVSKKVNLDDEQITERSLRDGMYAFLMKHKKKHLDQNIFKSQNEPKTNRISFLIFSK